VPRAVDGIEVLNQCIGRLPLFENVADYLDAMFSRPGESSLSNLCGLNQEPADQSYLVPDVAI
jgi:hypothetical protein